MWIIQAVRSGDYLTLLIGLAVRALMVFGIMPIHEYAHGWAASRLGDPTALRSGRNTFNPAAHIDPMGALCIVLVGFGWAKPVPVNPLYFKHRKRDMALTAAAGPASNLLLALLSAVLYNILYLLGVRSDATVLVFYYLITLNVSLAVFNLLPIPPLDGARIFAWVLPERVSWWVARYERIIMIVLMVAVFSGRLDFILDALNRWAFQGIMTIADAPFRLLGLF